MSEKEKTVELKVGDAESGLRLDVYLATMGAGSRSMMQQLIKCGNVSIADKAVFSPSVKVKTGDDVVLIVPESRKLEVAAENIPLDILYEDSDVIIVNKARGMVTHPAPGSESGTLVNALLAHCADLSGINGVMRPGIVHRLDKDTTGALSIAKNDRAHESLARQISERTLNRCYHAIVEGRFSEREGKVEAPIGRSPKDRKKMAVVADGRYALTYWKVIEEFKAPYTLLELRLKTGRTHQIRVHMASIGHPVAMDEVYGRRGKLTMLKGQALHSRTLGFVHPVTGEYIERTAPYPEDFALALEYLRRGGG